MPRGGKRPGFRFAVADHAGYGKTGIVKDGAKSMAQRISEFTALMDRSRALGGSMARNSTGKGKLGKKALQSGFVLADIRIPLAVSAFEIRSADHRRSAVPRSGHVNHVQVVFLDDPIQVRVNEILPRRRSPMAQQHSLDVRGCQRFFQQRVVAKINLADGQIVCGAPVRVDLPGHLRIEHRATGLFHVAAPSSIISSTRRVKSAITDSSSVRITRTATAPVEMRAACCWFS